jgi:hypothetical protein
MERLDAMASDETTHVVFICYSTKDRAIAFDVCEKLEVAGIRCWIAPRDITPAKPWGGEIVLAIKRSAVVLLIFTKHANESKDVRNEVVIASDLNRAILTYRHEEIVPCDELVYYLRSLQWFDAFTSVAESRFERLVSWFKRILATSVPGRAAAEAVEGLAELEKGRAEPRVFETLDGSTPPLGIASNADPVDTTRANLPAMTEAPTGAAPVHSVSAPATANAAVNAASAGEALLQETAHRIIKPETKAVPLLANKIFLDQVRRTLAAYIGPVAEEVVDDAANQAHTESEFYEICSQDLSSKERDRFLASVKGR